MLKNLGISAPLVESRPLFYDAAVDNAKNSDAAELHVGAGRGKAAVPVPGVGAAEDPEDGDEVVLGNGFYHRHAEVGEGPELTARPALIYLERGVAVDAVVAEVRRVDLSGDLGPALVENLLKDTERDSAIPVRESACAAAGGAVVGFAVAVDWAKTKDALARSAKMEVTRADFMRKLHLRHNWIWNRARMGARNSRPFSYVRVDPVGAHESRNQDRKIKDAEDRFQDGSGTRLRRDGCNSRSAE
jgi:hypothetical protein